MSIFNIFNKNEQNFKEGDIIRIEGDFYLITKTQIGNSDKLRINLKKLKQEK
jgi:hypothetical protein